MTKNPLVSIVIPVYNRSDLLKKALRSVLSQTYINYEIIIIDDGSHEDIKSIITGYNNPKMHYFYQKHCGAPSARNFGVRMAKAEIIAFLDSDDEWLNDKLEKQIACLNASSQQVGVIYSNYWIIKGKNKILGKKKMLNGNIFLKELFDDQISPTSCVLLRKACFDMVGGFDVKLPAREDYDLWLRIAQHYDFEHVKKPGIYINWNAPARISKVENCVKAVSLLLLKIRKLIRRYPKNLQKHIIANHYFNTGIFCWALKDTKKAKRFLIKAVKTYPWKISYLLVLSSLFLFGRNFHNMLFYIKMKVQRRL